MCHLTPLAWAPSRMCATYVSCGLPRQEGLAALRLLRPSLQSLEIIADWFSEEDLADVAALDRLEVLAFNTPSAVIGEQGSASLSILSNLRVLRLLQVHTTHLAALRALPRLEALHLVTPDLMVLFPDQLTMLEVDPGGADLYVQPGLLDQVLADLGAIPSLRHFVVAMGEAPFTHQGTRGLSQSRHLAYLDLSANVFMDDALAELSGLTSLRTLRLSETTVRDSDLAAIAALPSSRTSISSART
jgi:hypothetical protein